MVKTIKAPLVTSFCGCIELKIACIVTAWIRIIIALCFFQIIIFLQIKFEGTLNEEAFKVIFRFAVTTIITISFLNIRYSYLYIRGVIPVRCHYIIIKVTNK